MTENLAFTDRCIAKVQRMSIDKLFVAAVTVYLVSHGRLSYDPRRNLFWVRPPSGPAQVAVWMMSVCLAAEAA